MYINKFVWKFNRPTFQLSLMVKVGLLYVFLFKSIKGEYKPSEIYLGEGAPYRNFKEFFF